MAAVKKVVVKLGLHDDTQKHRAIKAVSTLCGIDEIVVDMKGDKMTVVGMVDPVDVVHKLRRRFCTVQVVSVGPAKQEEKNKDGNTKDTRTLVPVYLPCNLPHCWNPPCCHFVHTEEGPNDCAIC